MGKAIYDTPEHRAERKRVAPEVEAGHAYCMELVCLKPDRWIEPGTAWDLAHDRKACVWPAHRCTSACYLGPSHARCNRAEGGRERHQRQAPARWVL